MTLRKHIYLLRGRGQGRDLLQLRQLPLLLLQLLLMMAKFGRQRVVHGGKGGHSVILVLVSILPTPPAPRLLGRPVFLDTKNLMK